MSLAQQIIRRIRNWFRKPAEPQDPHAYVTAGLKRGPSGRSVAVALEEPIPQRRLDLFGRTTDR
jgi:hypothetical protein